MSPQGISDGGGGKGGLLTVFIRDVGYLITIYQIITIFILSLQSLSLSGGGSQ